MKPFQALFPILIISSLVTAQTAPTWSDNVACIIYTRCAGCHNPNGIAPFSLITYQEAFNARGIMQVAVNDRKMPPWPPDANFQRYVHERKLTQEEIDIINGWVNTGSAEGDTANAPEPPVFNNGSRLPVVDLSLRMPEYTNPAAKDDYRCFVMDPDMIQDLFITGWEVIPGNRNMVHHVLVFQDTTGAAADLDNDDPGPGYTSFGGIGTSNAILIGGWVPGSSGSYMPEGMGIRLFKNALIVMQVHYPAGTSGDTDSTRINMMLSSDAAIRPVRLAPILNHAISLTDGPLHIPANTVKTFHAQFTIPGVSDVTLLSAGPHMHLIGRSIMSYAVTPANDTINFIKINNWDFHWQGSYGFRQPIRVPKGSTLYAEATYDNTSGNRFNPNNPPQDVSLGEATTDEMMLVYFAFLTYETGDENIVIDTSSSVQTHNDCNYKLATSVSTTGVERLIKIYPNLVESIVNVENPHAEILIAEVYDLAGKLVFSNEILAGTTQLKFHNEAAGMYFIRVTTQGKEVLLNKRILRI